MQKSKKERTKNEKFSFSGSGFSAGRTLKTESGARSPAFSAVPDALFEHHRTEFGNVLFGETAGEDVVLNLLIDVLAGILGENGNEMIEAVLVVEVRIRIPETGGFPVLVKLHLSFVLAQ